MAVAGLRVIRRMSWSGLGARPQRAGQCTQPISTSARAKISAARVRLVRRTRLGSPVLS